MATSLVENTNSEIEPGLASDISDQMSQEIRAHILSSRIDEATDLLNAHFPFVLQMPSDDFPMHRRPVGLHLPLVPVLAHPAQPITNLSTRPIAFNLRILEFMEAARTIPLPYPPPHTPAGPSAPTGSIPDRSPEENAALLKQAKTSYPFVQSLNNNRDRDMYMKDMNVIRGLLAYRTPELSPFAKYMGQEQRERVADFSC